MVAWSGILLPLVCNMVSLGLPILIYRSWQNLALLHDYDYKTAQKTTGSIDLEKLFKKLGAISKPEEISPEEDTQPVFFAHL